MSDFSWSTAITIVLAFIGGGGGVFILNLLRQKKEQVRADKKQDTDLEMAVKKQEADLRLSETEKAFSIYKEIVMSLKHDIEQYTKSMQEQEKQYLEAREAKALMQGKLENCEIKIAFYEKELAELRLKVASK